MRRPAVREIVAIDRRDHDMAQAEFGNSIGNARRLIRIERARQARAHVAERAGPGARVAHDHEGGVLFLPALPDVGAAGLLADGDEPVLAHDAVRLSPLRRARRLHANPRGLARDGRIRPVRLFGVARCGRTRVTVEKIEENGHCVQM